MARCGPAPRAADWFAIEDGAFRIFGAAEGLTNLFVRAVFEDRDGRLWVGTDRGLFRLEGSALRRVDGQGDVPSMSVHAICEDRDGRILVGGRGLLVLDGDRVELLPLRRDVSPTTASGRFARAAMARCGSARSPDCAGSTAACAATHSSRRGSIDGTNISVLHESRTGQMWIATYGRGLMRVDTSGLVTLTCAGVAAARQRAGRLRGCREENVWVGTQGGLLRLRPQRRQHDHRRPMARRRASTRSTRIAHGSLFVAALNGRLFQVARQTLVPVEAAGAASRTLPIRNVFRDGQDRLWIGTDGRGVARVGRHAPSSGTR